MSVDAIVTSWFTFHYVSILITAPMLYLLCSVEVYIPLCLYFNWLRSSMMLTPLAVYIPLCLYFNSVAIKYPWISCLVYIPLCLYFNPIFAAVPLILSQFTFHSPLYNFTNDIPVGQPAVLWHSPTM